MSTQNPSYGTKVTDPNATNIREPAGAVASDSLAAESDGFSQNRGGEPLGVTGANSTFANTNTSGADTLSPAPNATSRLSGDEVEGKHLQQDKAIGVTDTTGSSATGGASSNADLAPTYVNSQYVDTGKPKGANLTDGGFDSDAKNASFSTDIGSENDPGRAAEQKFATATTRNEAGLAASAAQQGGTEGNQYGTLDSEKTA
ncbi:MAG: hypothetical protein M1818_004077 [Claussenomyces sp. TS43310]|nr:MAG: hypothetical protein M1818_004077 [Claussenomyces sp. TS43310]